jgi:hypothetical protein
MPHDPQWDRMCQLPPTSGVLVARVQRRLAVLSRRRPPRRDATAIDLQDRCVTGVRRHDGAVDSRLPQQLLHRYLLSRAEWKRSCAETQDHIPRSALEHHQICASTVVVASGAQYHKLGVENYLKYENRGLYYAATAMESVLCRDQEVIVVGGGNSAGQA